MSQENIAYFEREAERVRAELAEAVVQYGQYSQQQRNQVILPLIAEACALRKLYLSAAGMI